MEIADTPEEPFRPEVPLENDGQIAFPGDEIDTSNIGMAPGRGLEADIPGDSWVEHTADTPDTTAETVSPQDVVKLHFVPCTHIPATAKSVADALAAAGCKAVAIEAGGRTPEQAAALQRRIDTILDPETIQPEREAALRDLFRQDRFVANIMLFRPPSLERARLFDVGADHPAQPHLQASLEAERQTEEGLESHAPNDELRATIRTMVEELVAADPTREATRIEQLQAFSLEEATIALQQAAATGQPLTERPVLSIVHDSLHEATPLRMAADGFDCSATEPIEDPNVHRETPRLVGELYARLSQDPNLSLTAEDVDRVLLESMARRAGILPDQALEFATTLPDHMLTPLMNDIDTIKQLRGTPREMHIAIFERIEQAEADLEALRLAQERVAFHFVECEHSVENAQLIAEALEGCQTVVFEMAGYSPAQRAEVESHLNIIMDPTTPDEPFQASVDYFRPWRDTSAAWLPAVVAHLPDSVHKIKLMDIAADHPGFRTVLEWRYATMRAGELLLSNAPNADLRPAIAKVIELGAKSDIIREPLMPVQLRTIAIAEAPAGAQRIGAVTGGNHPKVRQDTAAGGFTTTATTIDPLKRNPEIRDEVIRWRVEHQDQELHSLDIDRVILEGTAMRHGFNALRAGALVRQLSPGDLYTLMQKLDELKALGSPQERQDQIAAALLEAEGI